MTNWGPRDRPEPAGPAGQPVSGRRERPDPAGCAEIPFTARRAPEGRRRRNKAGRFSTRPQAGERRFRGPVELFAKFW